MDKVIDKVISKVGFDDIRFGWSRLGNRHLQLVQFVNGIEVNGRAE